MTAIRLFISHSERDTRLVGPLYNWLQCALSLDDEEIRCTAIDEEVQGGAAPTNLRRDIEQAEALVGLLTTNSLRSYWVAMEMGAGWLREQLFPVRGPGMSFQHLPSPLPQFTTFGYCSTRDTNDLLKRLSRVLDREIAAQAEFEQREMVQSAERLMSSQVRCWFNLPAILSASRLDPVSYTEALYSVARELEIEDLREVEDCVEPTGLIVRDPEFLPVWASEHWRLAKLVINHILTGTGEIADLPTHLLDPGLIADLTRLWLNPCAKRGRLLHDWQQRASDYLSAVDNLPLDARGH